jgi:hypothetical protein
LRTWSLHDGGWHCEPVHTPLAQSVPFRHVLPAAQAGHDPPQSASDSEPLVTPSLHVGGAQVPLAAQKPVAQSAALPQACPTAHLPQFAPPQSTALSVPLRTPSLHAGVAQVPLQTRL